MKRRGKTKKWVKITVFAGIILIILAGLYLGTVGYLKWRNQRNDLIFQQGIQLGYTEAVLQIMNLSLSCQPVPVYAGNVSIELIAVDCLG